MREEVSIGCNLLTIKGVGSDKGVPFTSVGHQKLIKSVHGNVINVTSQREEGFDLASSFKNHYPVVALVRNDDIGSIVGDSKTNRIGEVDGARAILPKAQSGSMLVAFDWQTE